MSRERLIDILKNIDRPLEIPTVEAKRAQFFRRLLAEHKVNEAKFNSLLDDYIKTHRQPHGKWEEMAIRGNLMRELARPEMTEKVLKRGLDLLKLPHSLLEQLA
ncbi:hypothetical protein [Burkholderia phage FLC9]|nr:hypothetical protein [Burkholderia phage FLC9]